jgi:hypothetical protein
MAIPLDRLYLDGDVLEVFDQLALALGRLHRERRISDEDWTTSKQGLAESRIRVEASLTH